MKHVSWVAPVLVVALGCGASQSPRGSASYASNQPTPQTPSRQAVVEAMNSVTDAARTCGGGAPGEVSVRFVFSSSGVVSDVTTNAEYAWFSSEPGPECDPTPDDAGHYSCRRNRAPVPDVDRCVLDAVRVARIPPFTRASYSVNYPFRY